ncbi:MAG: dTMP kinase [Clostridia bacterium]|nr:dTMP kinase [Clostridia bacterium]
MEGAVGAGVVPVGVLYGYGNEQELLESGARIICKDVAELRKLLLGDTPKPSGSFITLEGSDGCGKSTQHKLLKEYLEMCGIEVISTREPGGCPISERIRNVLLDVKSLGMTDECEALLFAAARKQHVNDTILPALNRGCTVICDRFVDSSIAYQGAGRGLGEWVKQINMRAVEGCLPDLTLVFDLSPTEALKRRYSVSEADRIELASFEFQQKVYDAFMDMCKSGNKRFYKVDATGSIEQIQSDVRQIVINKLNQVAEDDANEHAVL